MPIGNIKRIGDTGHILMGIYDNYNTMQSGGRHGRIRRRISISNDATNDAYYWQK